MMKDRDENVLTGSLSVMERWKESFKELMNEESRVHKIKGGGAVNQKVTKISKNGMRKTLIRMKSGNTVGPDNKPAEE